jgi:hypothetical protein
MHPAVRLITGCMLAALAACSDESADITSNPRAFDTKAWQADRGIDRCDMAEDLIERVGLRGRTHAELVDLIGEAYKRDGRSDFYYLCPSFMDIYVLEIRWRNERVAEAVIRDT